MTSSSNWNATQYDTQHSYVWKHGVGVVELLAPQPGERILDIGCGTGHLTAQIAQMGATVVGIDNAPSMIEAAKQSYPGLHFEVANGADFHFEKPFEAVFSNAALHWIHPPAGVVACVAAALQPGGRFVAEFGGKGNIAAILDALYPALEAIGLDPRPLNPWYFPSIAEYASLLEQHGLAVTFAWLFDRPTLVDGGEAGLRQWLTMFCQVFLAAVPPGQRDGVMEHVERLLRPKLFKDGVWIADYRRLRVVALKEG